jgi:hypothetical protein
MIENKDWKGMDGAVAWHLIDRHADNWNEAGEMMTEWLEANKQSGPDKNVEAVREKLLQRSIVGLKKYGVTTERDDVDLAGWLEHLQLELLDAVIYIEAAKGKIND